MTQKLSRRPGRSWLVAAMLLAIALLAPEWPGARIALSVGSVEIGRGEPPVWTPGDAGDALGAGDRVRTGADGRAEVTVAGATLRLYPNSLLRLPAQAPREAESVELHEGTSLFDVLRRDQTPFEVHTPEVVVSVKGTRFAVAVGADEASVSVFRGLVGVRGDGQGPTSETLVHPGFLAHGSDRFELSWRGTDDPWESWGDGLFDTDALRGEPVEAALQDARFAALDLAKELPVPASQAPESGREPKEDVEEEKKENAPPERDPVVDAGEDTKRELVVSIIQDTLDGPDPTPGNGGGATSPVLDILFLDGSGRPGSDVVQVVDGATTWVFERDDLEEIVDDDDSLPPELVSILNDRGVQEEVFANQLLSLFGGSNGSSDDD